MTKRPNTETGGKKIPLSNFETGGENRCEVCFVNTTRGNQDERFEIMYCRKCSRGCHRGCYDLTVEEQSFICDSCKYTTSSYLKRICIVCENEGLLKKVGVNKFAHVVCALFYLDPQLKSYDSLDFVNYEINPKMSQKQHAKCKLCNKVSPYTQQCPYDGCVQACHLYCCLKNFDPDGNSHQSILTLRDLSAKNSGSPKGLIACATHYNQYKQCICANKDKDQSVMCDQCLQWYHYSCLKINDESISESASFFCEFCKQWNTKGKSMNYQMSTYPRLHFYDFLKILRTNSSSKNQNGIEVVKRLPFKRDHIECFNRELEAVNRSFGNVLAAVIVKSTVESINGLVLESETYQNIQRFLASKSGNKSGVKNKGKAIKESKDTKEAKAMRTPRELNDLIKNTPNLKVPKNSNLQHFQKFMKTPNDFSLNIHILTSLISSHLSAYPPIQVYCQTIQIIETIKARCGIKYKNWFNQLTLFNFINHTLTERDKYNYYQVFCIAQEIMAISRSNMSDVEKYREYLQDVAMPFNALPVMFQGILMEVAEQVTDDGRNEKREGEFQRVQKWLGVKKIPFEEYDRLRMCISGLYQSSLAQKLQVQYSQLRILDKRMQQIIQSQPSLMNLQTLRMSIDRIQKHFTLQLSQSYLLKYRNYIKQFSQFYKLIFQIQQFYTSSEIPYLSPFTYRDQLRFLQTYFQYCSTNNVQLSIDVFSATSSLVDISINPEFKWKLALGFNILLESVVLECVEAESIQKWNGCIKYLDLEFEDSVEFLIQEEEFKRWKSTKVEVINRNCMSYLSNYQKIPQLLQLIEDAQNTAAASKLNITRFKKYFKMLQVWGSITLKLSQILLHKATPGAIKEVMDIIKISKYPVEIPYCKRISLLLDKVKELQSTVNKFKKVNNSKEEVEVSMEIPLMDSKIKESDIKKIINKLNDTSIDYRFEIGDIETELEFFKAKQKEAEAAWRAEDVEEMEKLFRFFLYDTAFVYDKFKEFRDKLKGLKCLEMPKSRKQYERLVRWGGEEVKVLMQNCRGAMEVYGQLERAELSLARKKRHEYIPIEEIVRMRENLFEQDIKREVITEWIKEFFEIQEKVQFLFSRMNHKKYSPQLIQNYINAYDRFPIKSGLYHRLTELKSLAHKLQTEFRELAEAWEEQDGPLTEEDADSLLNLVFRLRENKLVLSEFYWNIIQIESYSELIEQEPEDHVDYITYLQRCNRLPPQLKTHKLYRKRLNYFLQNKHLIADSLTKQEAQKYITEGVTLMNLITEQEISVQDIQSMIDVMNSKPPGRRTLKRMRSHDDLEMGQSQNEDMEGEGEQDQDQDSEGLNELEEEEESGEEDFDSEESQEHSESPSAPPGGPKGKHPSNSQIDEIVIDDD